MVSLTDFEFQQMSGQGDKGFWKIGSRPVIRVGNVLSQEFGGMGHSGPCFRTSIPTDAGMSGGFAYIPRDSQSIAACGIVSANLDFGQPTTRFDVCGNSLMAGILGTMVLPIPQMSDGSGNRILLDLVRSGEVMDVAGGGKNISVRQTDGGYEIVRKGDR